MKYFCVFLLLLSFQMGALSAQNGPTARGNKVYVLPAADNSDMRDITKEFKQQLSQWDYWQVTENKKQADLCIDLHIDTRRGMTWTSWGGKSVILSASLQYPNGKRIWQSQRYKRSPNGSNGFNSGGAVIRKLMAEIKKEFK